MNTDDSTRILVSHFRQVWGDCSPTEIVRCEECSKETHKFRVAMTIGGSTIHGDGDNTMGWTPPRHYCRDCTRRLLITHEEKSIKQAS